MAALKPVEVEYALLKYARYTNCSTTAGRGEADMNQSEAKDWKYYEATEETPLTLALTDSQQFVISFGNTILESLYLVGGYSWMRGVCKGDSMMIMCKIQSETRKFRMKFSATELCKGVQQCASCTTILKRYFPLKAEGDLEKVINFEECLAQENMDNPKNLLGDVSIEDMAQALSGEMFASMPLAYHHSNMPTEEMGTILRLCLADSSFPQFVGQVEAELKNIVKSSCKHS